MGKSIFEKIIADHLVKGEPKAGEEIAIKIDHTLTQDALGALAYLQFEATKTEKIATELSVSYVDHLMMQSGEGNADVHSYLESVADNYNILYSKPGNGVCHQIHMERFSRPGKTLVGCDSHTVTCGGVGMAAFGVGGLDVALTMAGYPYYFTYPKVVRVVLENSLPAWSAGKDVILEVLRRITSKGNVGTVLEYAGQGVTSLTVPQRGTIANMGTEAGVTTSVFPSDQVTKAYFAAQGREDQWTELLADPDARYDSEILIDLSKIEPSVAVPHSPDNVKPVSEVKNLKVDQVLIGSCTNSSYQDMMNVALMLRGKKVHPDISLGIAPGSRQVFMMMMESGALGWMVEAGARILELACGFCVGHGQAPRLGGISVRTGNRNYKGRSGTQDDNVYLVSPETAAATALTGVLTDPRTLGIEHPNVPMPDKMKVDDSMILHPTGKKEIYRSRLIGKPPINDPMPEKLVGQVAIKLGDMINTDDIIPAGHAQVYRANVQKSCEFVFQFIDPTFPATCAEIVGRQLSPIIVGGLSYGQGSSREHAAICPMAMGVRCLVARSIERIHQANLVNFGILPLTFEDDADYDSIEKGDRLVIKDARSATTQDYVIVLNESKNKSYKTKNTATVRQRECILAGGSLNMVVK